VHPQNGYRNGPLYGAYVVESMIRTYELSKRAGIEIEGAVTWAFLFEEQPWFDGFRDLATNGVDKPVLKGEWVEAKSDHAVDITTIMEHGIRDKPDVNAVATRDDTGVSVLVWNYHDDNVEDGAANVTINLGGLKPGNHAMTHYRMDKDHSNSYGVWQAMGSPQDVSGEEFTKLEAAGQLATLETGTIDASNGTVTLTTALPRQGVSLVRIDY
jgi:xylan 1,4-beta-xylosidase